MDKRKTQFVLDQIAKLPKAPTAMELMAMKFEAKDWVVPNLIPKGLTIFAGAPKLGKSWMALNMATAISRGGHVLGKISVARKEVLYLALEDTNQRLQDRLSKMGGCCSENLYLSTFWPTDGEGVLSLEAWLVEHPDTKCIFVDTLQKFTGLVEGNDYGMTYRTGSALKQVADRYDLAIIVIHHTRKMDARDFVQSVAGSIGLTGSADTIITMTRPRGQHDAILSVTGRDVEEKNYGVRFDADIGTWCIMDCVPKTPSIRG